MSEAREEPQREGAEPLVFVKDLRKSYGKREVLSGLSFEIGEGTVTALVGPSGSGKSTMLRVMVGLEPFDAGEVRVADAKLRPGPLAANPVELQRLHLATGMVFQQWHLFPHMSALENVCEAPVQVRGVPLAKARERAKELLEEVGLSHRAGAMPRQMSGGEQQRCAIARALAMQPKVLFMDEPTSALDPARVTDLVELLGSLREKEKLSMVIVTHEMRFAARLADRALVLFDGVVAEDGAPADVLASPSDERTRRFLGI